MFHLKTPQKAKRQKNKQYERKTTAALDSKLPEKISGKTYHNKAKKSSMIPDDNSAEKKYQWRMHICHHKHFQNSKTRKMRCRNTPSPCRNPASTWRYHESATQNA
jgi:hypothetical protein